MIIVILTVLLLLAGIVVLIVYRNKLYVEDSLEVIGVIITMFGGFAVLLATMFMVSGRITSRGQVAELNTMRDQLVVEYNKCFESQPETYTLSKYSGNITDYNVAVADLKAKAESPFANWFVVSEAKDLKLIEFYSDSHLAYVK
jgi:hypothetical protein